MAYFIMWLEEMTADNKFIVQLNRCIRENKVDSFMLKVFKKSLHDLIMQYGQSNSRA